MLVIPSGGSAVEEFLIKRQESRDVSASLDMTKGTGEYAEAQGQAPFKDEILCCSLSAPSIKKL